MEWVNESEDALALRTTRHRVKIPANKRVPSETGPRTILIHIHSHSRGFTRAVTVCVWASTPHSRA